jgi:hypothetical protein
MEFERLTQGRAFGPLNRYRTDKCRDRFGNIVYITLDAELADDFTGGPSIIRQDSTIEEANESRSKLSWPRRIRSLVP